MYISSFLHIVHVGELELRLLFRHLWSYWLSAFLKLFYPHQPCGSNSSFLTEHLSAALSVPARDTG